MSGKKEKDSDNPMCDMPSFDLHLDDTQKMKATEWLTDKEEADAARDDASIQLDKQIDSNEPQPICGQNSNVEVHEEVDVLETPTPTSINTQELQTYVNTVITHVIKDLRQEEKGIKPNTGI
ncbi:unnamed protein product [Cuscuta europaea]|uniref:Uncharacterized protein n=1 Tax=Cuscuta europaea TaxID=41803 RepID=A0A9P0ZN29_CUSEU|nr:unnamed protein product [Cuscuta europaea]